MQRFMKFSKRNRSSSSRRGQMLLMFFFFLLAFLPLMALVVDLSLVQLVRREMQTAVNAAALEGLRGQSISLGERDAPQRQARVTPLLFGHFWPQKIKDIHARGVTAKAVAEARPAMIVGPAFRELTDGPEDHRDPVFLRGAAPFAVEAVEWERSCEPRTYVLNVTERELCPENGQDCENPIPVIPLRVQELRDADNDREPPPVEVIGPITVGLPTELLGYEEDEDEEKWSHALTHTGTYEYYLPLYDTVPLRGAATSIRLIVGFGRVLIGPVVPSSNETARIVTFLDDQVVAPHNAASVARSNWQADLREFLLARLPAEEVPSELQRLVNLAWRRAAEISCPDGQSEDAPRRGHGLLAPALVRALD